MTRQNTPRQVDQSALKVNQAAIIALLLVAFVSDFWPLLVFTGLVMAIGTIWPSMTLFKRIYGHVLRPLGMIEPRLLSDNPEPHRFAQGMGSAVLGAATVALLAGLTVAGWALAWLVIALAALNLLVGFCAGCFVYYQLNRLGVPGFERSPL